MALRGVGNVDPTPRVGVEIRTFITLMDTRWPFGLPCICGGMQGPPPVYRVVWWHLLLLQFRWTLEPRGVESSPYPMNMHGYYNVWIVVFNLITVEFCQYSCNISLLQANYQNRVVSHVAFV